MVNTIFKIRIAAIFLVATGYGWAGGHFIPADSPLYAYLFQLFILLLLLVLLLAFIHLYGNEHYQPKRAINSLTIFCTLSLLLNIGNIIRGVRNTTVFGSHNTFADLVPICLIISGSLIWIFALLYINARQKAKRA